MNNQDVLELIAYMTTSAAGLRNEPHIYGPLRLIEASQRLALMLAETDEEHRQDLTELAALIEERKNDCMYDEESFYSMLNDAAAKLVDCF